jgi:hypothetical protein
VTGSLYGIDEADYQSQVKMADLQVLWDAMAVGRDAC